MLDFVGDEKARRNLLVEAAVFKIVNRQKYLETSQDGVVEKDDVIVSLLADLQQEQDQESEKLVNDLQDKVSFSHLHLVTLVKKNSLAFYSVSTSACAVGRLDSCPFAIYI